MKTPAKVTECPDCNGEGRRNCGSCDGTGLPYGWNSSSVCTSCYGSGNGEECEACGGSGQVELPADDELDADQAAADAADAPRAPRALLPERAAAFVRDERGLEVVERAILTGLIIGLLAIVIWIGMWAVRKIGVLESGLSGQPTVVRERGVH